MATSDGDRIETGRSAMRKGSASGAAHGERAPVSWAKTTVADFGGTGVSDCVVGSTAMHISGSNPSRSAMQSRGPFSTAAAIRFRHSSASSRGCRSGCRPERAPPPGRPPRVQPFCRLPTVSRHLPDGRRCKPNLRPFRAPSYSKLHLLAYASLLIANSLSDVCFGGPAKRHFSFEDLLVGNAAAQTLSCQNREFGFGHVEPASMFGRVMPFEPLSEVARFWCGEAA